MPYGRGPLYVEVHQYKRVVPKAAAFLAGASQYSKVIFVAVATSNENNLKCATRHPKEPTEAAQVAVRQSVYSRVRMWPLTPPWSRQEDGARN